MKAPITLAFKTKFNYWSKEKRKSCTEENEEQNNYNILLNDLPSSER